MKKLHVMIIALSIVAVGALALLALRGWEGENPSIESVCPGKDDSKIEPVAGSADSASKAARSALLPRKGNTADSSTPERPGNRIEGVVYAADLLPVAGVIVAVAGETVKMTITTDSVGRFTAKGLPAGLYRLIVVYRGNQAAQRVVNVSGRNSTLTVRIYLKSKPRLILRVKRKATGETLRDFKLQFYRLMPGFGPIDYFERELADVEDPLVIADLKEGVYSLLARSGDDEVSQLHRFTLVAGETHELTIYVETGGFVSGDLVGAASGTPATGAAIGVFRVLASTRSDRFGRFKLALPPGTWALSVRHPDFSWTIIPKVVVESGKEKRLGQIALRKGVKVKVSVTRSGRPEVGSLVYIVGRNGYRSIRKTDKKGLLLTEAIPAGSYTFSTGKPRLMVTRTIGPDYAGVVALELESLFEVRVRITTERDKPVHGARLTIFRFHKGNVQSMAQAVTNERGWARFGRGIDISADYVVTVAVPGTVPHTPGNFTSLAFAVRVNSRKERFSFRLPGSKCEGRVFDSVGSPIKDASVVVLARSIEDPRIDSALDSAISASGRTDARGKFVLPYLPTGQYYLRVKKDGYSVVQREIAIPGRFQDINLFRVKGLGTIRGTVLNQKGVGVAAVVILEDRQGRPVAGMKKTDIGGNFEFSRVPAGEYRLAAEGQANKFTKVDVRVVSDKTVTGKITVN